MKMTLLFYWKICDSCAQFITVSADVMCGKTAILKEIGSNVIQRSEQMHKEVL